MIQWDVLAPLERLCGASMINNLAPILVSADEMPEPSRHLLVHQGDMTSRLESFYEKKIAVRALATEYDAASGDYAREVILETVPEQLPVEYGAIIIRLARLRHSDWPGLAAKILEAKRPLGGLLTEYKVPFSSEPRAFLRLIADQALAETLQCEAGSRLYARRNVLRLVGGPEIADIVEIVR